MTLVADGCGGSAVCGVSTRMCWKVEVWVATKQWKRVGEVDTLAEAKEAVVTIADQYGVARATLQGDAKGGWCGMRALRGRGFCCWTGSGGLYGA